MSTIRKGIHQFLKSRKASSPFLIERWSPDLESQFLVHEGNVEVEPGSNAWTDGSETWAHHRWPYKAGSSPYYKDKPLKFSPGAHMNRIGSTWWSWKTKKSVAVAFDIDMEGDGHAATTTTVTESELEAVAERLKQLPYVTLVRSTGGKGMHVYVFFDEGDQPEAVNHNEHTQVALATLTKMNKDANYDFSQHMDVKGVILWFWADSSPEGHDGFSLVHEASEALTASAIAEFREIALTGPNNSVKVTGYDDDNNPVTSETNSGGYKTYPLEDEHKIILRELEDLEYDFIWNAEFNMVHTNTRALRDLFQKREAMGNPLKGMFETTSVGSVRKPNCFMTPRPGGGFQVKRFGNGIAEHASWETKDNDTWCYFNQDAPVGSVLRRFCSKQTDSKYTFEPRELEAALKALGHSLGESVDHIQSAVTVTRRDDGTFYATCKDTGHLEGWKVGKNGNSRELPVVQKPEARQNSVLEDVDDIARFMVTPQYEPYGWALNTKLGWISHSSYDGVSASIRQAFGKEADFVKSLMDQNPWVMVNVPFGKEYPNIDSDREWNKLAAQFAIEPATEAGPHPHWDKIYEHLGESLDSVARRTKWCQEWGITSGADYLRFWMAALIQYPFEPLPYLFFYGPQNSGKSIFHESAAILFTEGSIQSAAGALTNNQGFNYELANAVIGFIEEKDLSSSKESYARMKEWITSKTLTVTKKGETPYTQPNVLKMVHMANSPRAIGMEDGDTRITALAVAILMNMIPKGLLEQRLRKEAPYFLRTLLTTHIPATPDRLRVPMLASQNKTDLESMNQEPWEAFASEVLFPCDGSEVKFADFYEKYLTDCVLNNRSPEKHKTLLQLIRNRGDKYAVGLGKNKTIFIGNVSLDPKAVPTNPKLRLNKKGRLVQCTE